MIHNQAILMEKETEKLVKKYYKNIKKSNNFGRCYLLYLIIVIFNKIH